ncbi:hypothetical protein WN944_002403 [Citrus x changshan-huyou]|uniref:Uncharacterized protein n=1 Tax=Citrus x changshan-huyou TaxID=2935761 RepID=A0AAP0MIZ4_9ROSI
MAEANICSCNHGMRTSTRCCQLLTSRDSRVWRWRKCTKVKLITQKALCRGDFVLRLALSRKEIWLAKVNWWVVNLSPTDHGLHSPNCGH